MKINTTYMNAKSTDNTEYHGKVFVVKGEEDYTRTTDILFEPVTFEDSFDSALYYRIGGKINVLRDIGESSVTLYCNDEPLLDNAIEWSDEQGEYIIGTEEEGGFILPYYSHNVITAKYNGNKKCLKSISVPYDSYYETEKVSELTFVDPITSVDADECDVTLKLEATVMSECYEQVINVYVDGVLNITLTTPSDSNIISGTVTGLTYGRHTIQAVYDGTAELEGSDASYDVSSGYVITVDNTILLPNAENTLYVHVLDYNGDAIEDTTVSIIQNDITLSDTCTTDSNGLATITTSALNTSFKIKVNDYVSDLITIDYATVTGISPVDPPSYVETGNSHVLVYNIGGTDIVKDIPVDVSIGSTTTTYYTDDNGNISVPLTVGDVYQTNITLSAGGYTTTHTIDTYLRNLKNNVNGLPYYIGTDCKITRDSGGHIILSHTGNTANTGYVFFCTDSSLSTYVDEKYQIQFTISSVSSSTSRPSIVIPYKRNGTVTDYYLYNLTQGDNIGIRMRSSNIGLEIFINNSRITVDVGSLTSDFMFGLGLKSISQIRIKDFTIRRLQ